MKKFWDSIKDYVFIVIIVILIRIFIIDPAIVSGSSMDYTLEDGQIVLVNKYLYRFTDIKRFDIVVVKNSEDNDKIIKRVVGLPGERIRYSIEEDRDGNSVGILYVNDKVIEEEFLDKNDKLNTCTFHADICENEITIPDGEYYVMGDNRLVSKDSRYFGTFTKKEIVGRVKFRLTPFKKFGFIEK